MRTCRVAATSSAAALAIPMALIALAVPAPLGSSTAEVPAFFRSFDREGIADDAIVLLKGEVAYSGPVSELGDVQARVLGQ